MQARGATFADTASLVKSRALSANAQKIEKCTTSIKRNCIRLHIIEMYLGRWETKCITMPPEHQERLKRHAFLDFLSIGNPRSCKQHETQRIKKNVPIRLEERRRSDPSRRSWSEKRETSSMAGAPARAKQRAESVIGGSEIEARSAECGARSLGLRGKARGLPCALARPEESPRTCRIV